jgi:Arc/MetJ-type ribon-helix-helix transcriptional regulator
MNITTVNISLPTTMYEDAKKHVKRRGYASVSELIRDAVREWLYPRITVNGFTPKFEKLVLAAEKEPRENDRVWNGKGSFTDFLMNKNQPKKKLTK